MSKKTTDFGKTCRAYRAKLGLNMTQLEEIVDKTQSTISKIELGGQSPSIDYIKRSIDAYKIKDQKEQMDFLLSCLNSFDKIEIPLNELDPERKEWLAALLILKKEPGYNSKGLDTIIEWTEGFLEKLNISNKQFTVL
jgi:transcriptional regulator with XRE-family HTH domain